MKEEKGATSHLLSTAREYITHWAVAGLILSLTGFAPDHWVADVYNHLAQYLGIEHGRLPNFDIRIVLVAVGVSIIAWDIVHRSRLDRKKRVSESPIAQSQAALPDRAATAATVIERSSIAVLPFKNIGTDPEQDYFAEGLTAYVTTDLSRISGLFVIASTTTATLEGSTFDTRQVCKDLNVRYALQGAVQKIGDTVRINAQLVDGISSAQIWSERFDGDRKDLFDLQDQITARIANSIGREIFAATARSSQADANPDANDYFVRGIALSDKPQTLENLQQQEAAFKTVLRLAPTNGDGWARLARAILLQHINFSGLLEPARQNEILEEGVAAVERALALDSNNGRAHLAEGLVFLAQRNPAECARANEQAIALDRNLALAHNNLGASLIHLGQPEKALPRIEQAMRLDPLGPQIAFMQANMGKANLLLGRNEAAIDWLLKARRSNPKLARTLAFLAASYAVQGNLTEAQDVAMTLKRIGPQYRLSASPDAPSSHSPNAYRKLYSEILLPAATKAGVPE